MTEHRNLTGASLHEPKGVETASSGDVYIANGLGSGTWAKPLSSIQNINAFYLTGRFADISAPSSVFIVVPCKSTLDKISGVLDGPITIANSVITVYKNGGTMTQTITVPFAGSTSGTKAIQAMSPVISFAAGDVLELRNDGAATTTAGWNVTLSFTAVA